MECTPLILKTMKLKKLREKLQIPKHLWDHFYFKIKKEEIKDEQNFVAWEIIERKKKEEEKDVKEIIQNP
jgi:ribosomal protein L19E